LPEAVFGQPDFTSNLRNRGTEPAANTLASPYGLAIDDAGRLWVVDSRNARILRFDNAATKPSGANADGVLGQPDFTTVSTAGDSIPTQSNLSSQVVGIAVDNAGNLYVADGNNINICRVLRWNNAADKPNGAPADGVLGQAGFISARSYRGGTRPTANNLRAAFGVAVDQEGTLYVADLLRVLRFDNAATKPNGADADGVLGQPDFVSGSNALTQDRMNGPFSVGVDGEGNLYVGDTINRRTLVFLRAKTKPNGAPADFVLGQLDFSSNRNEVSQSIAAAPSQIAIDNRNGKIWLAFGAFVSNNQNRVLRLSAGRPLSVKYNDAKLPKVFSLSQNYPNPFNPITRFDFSIPRALKVSLKIYDLRGKEVAMLINEHRTAGIYNVTFDANGISTGIYFYRLQAGNFIETQKMILMK
jgi:sugar lactone lactonase YvrE